MLMQIDTGEWVILVTTVLGFAVQLFREHRNRKWEIEDRRMAAETLRRETVQAAEALKKESAKTRDLIVQKIDENTQINVDALKQANHVGDKLARMDALIDNVRTREQLDHVQAVVDETKEVVHVIETDTGIIKDKLEHHDSRPTRAGSAERRDPR